MDIKTEGVDGSVQVGQRDGYQKVVILLKKMEWTTYDIGLLVYEIYHAVKKDK